MSKSTTLSKICTGCGETKPITEFYFNSRGVSGKTYDTLCKPCKRAQTREYLSRMKGSPRDVVCVECGITFSTKHIKKYCSDDCKNARARRHKASYQLARKDEHKKWIASMKKCCCVCGESRTPEVLDFHHYDPSTKELKIGQQGAGQKREIVLAEIAKCIVLCASCHRLLHAGYVPVVEAAEEAWQTMNRTMEGR